MLPKCVIVIAVNKKMLIIIDILFTNIAYT
jgi:hypothetical protein